MNQSLIEQCVSGYTLRRIAPQEFLEAVFDGCHNQNLIGIGSVRPSKTKPQPFLHYLAPVAVEDRRSMFMQVVEGSKPAPPFFCYNTFAPASYPITKAGRKILPATSCSTLSGFDGGRCSATHSGTQSYHLEVSSRQTGKI